MADVVLDSSAVLAYFNAEPGGEVVFSKLATALISSVNYAEVVSKLIDRGLSAHTAAAAIKNLSLEVAPFDEALALRSAALHEITRGRGISLGDRACLALAAHERLPVLTADRVWANLNLDLTIEMIR